MGTNVSVAIIVPVYNEAQALRDHLQSLIDVGADELIIVDGGSCDETVNILRQSGVLCVQSELGRAMQMNAGAKIVKSDIIIFIHVDTEFNESNLLTLKAVFKQSDSVIGGRFDVRLSGRHRAFRMIEWMINQRSRMSKISTGDQCQFVRRDVFESMGGFSHMPLLEDVDFSKRLKREGKIACLPEQVVTSSRRWEKHGILRTIWLMWKIRLLYWLGSSSETLAQLYRHAR